MNENIDLTKILKDCPEGTKLYTPIWGEVTFIKVSENVCNLYPIIIYNECDHVGLTKDGRYLINKQDSECILFPSKDMRDWSKFTVPWYKKEKFDPKTLKAFDRVLVRNFKTIKWRCEHFSYFDGGNYNPCIASFCSYAFCIPYNDDTRHLVGTTDEAPEYYRYWED